MSQRFLSVRPLAMTLAGCCALLMIATATLAQAPAPRQLPPPVSTGDSVRPLLPAQLDDFDAYMAETLKIFKVPGIAVAIVKNSKPSLPLGDYVGIYRDPWYGDVLITRENGRLRLCSSKSRQLIGTMTPWQHDNFTVRWEDPSLDADAFVDFALDMDGHIRQMRMQPISPLTDFSFDFQDLRLVPVSAVGASSSKE